MMTESRRETKRIQYTSEQKQTLVDLIQKDKNLLSGKFTSQFTAKCAQKRWETIATTLNSIPGARKDWKQWRKVSSVL